MDGDLSQDLLRPVSIFTWELGHAVSMRIAGLLLDFIPALVVFSLILGADFLQPLPLLRFCLAASVAFLIVFALNAMVGLLTIFIPGARAMLNWNHMVIAFLGGAFIALEFFPGWVQNVLNSLPFAYVFYWPIQFFLNRGVADTWEAFLFREAIALVWVAVLFGMCHLLWQKAVRQYTDVGG
jgi:ABC-2 type transport system permease protein